MERSEFSNSSSISSEGSVQDPSQKISQPDEASSNHQETVNLTFSIWLIQFFLMCHWYKFLDIVPKNLGPEEYLSLYP